MKNKEKRETKENITKNIKKVNEKYLKMKKEEILEALEDKDNEIKNYQIKLEQIQQKTEELKKNENIYKDQLLRMQADFENYKKREEKKKKDFMEYANKDLICKLLSVIDNLERAVSYSHNQKHQSESIRKGIESVLKDFQKILEKEGLAPIKSLGKRFDPYCHEAIMQVESDKYPEDTVTEEITKGYYLKSNVIRPAIVKVSKGKNQDDTDKDINNNDK